MSVIPIIIVAGACADLRGDPVPEVADASRASERTEVGCRHGMDQPRNGLDTGDASRDEDRRDDGARAGD
jgi:hypothetical protein